MRHAPPGGRTQAQVVEVLFCRLRGGRRVAVQRLRRLRATACTYIIIAYTARHRTCTCITLLRTTAHVLPCRIHVCTHALEYMYLLRTTVGVLLPAYRLFLYTRAFSWQYMPGHYMHRLSGIGDRQAEPALLIKIHYNIRAPCRVRMYAGYALANRM